MCSNNALSLLKASEWVLMFSHYWLLCALGVSSTLQFMIIGKPYDPRELFVFNAYLCSSYTSLYVYMYTHILILFGHSNIPSLS